jgi:hypothetical protein
MHNPQDLHIQLAYDEYTKALLDQISSRHFGHSNLKTLKLDLRTCRAQNKVEGILQSNIHIAELTIDPLFLEAFLQLGLAAGCTPHRRRDFLLSDDESDNTQEDAIAEPFPQRLKTFNIDVSHYTLRGALPKQCRDPEETLAYTNWMLTEVELAYFFMHHCPFLRLDSGIVKQIPLDLHMLREGGAAELLGSDDSLAQL